MQKGCDHFDMGRLRKHIQRLQRLEAITFAAKVSYIPGLSGGIAGNIDDFAGRKGTDPFQHGFSATRPRWVDDQNIHGIGELLQYGADIPMMQ